MRLDQNGLQVSGVYTASGGSNNKVTGTVSGIPPAQGQSVLNGQFTVKTRHPSVQPLPVAPGDIRF